MCKCFARGILFAFTLVVASCAGPTKTAADESSRLRLLVADLSGRYEWDSRLARYVLDNADRLYKISSGFSQETIVDALIDCTDSMEPSKVILDATTVPLGVVCHEGLTQHVYYEPIDDSGDVAEEWAGYFEPTANRATLRAAKAAWLKVKESKSYQTL